MTVSNKSHISTLWTRSISFRSLIYNMYDKDTRINEYRLNNQFLHKIYIYDQIAI